ncbi:calcium-activated potassium channel subunit alpha-1 [Thraustotheca clavata]|uniref:Calcium-activated potassium channel subunit alpha-1 n=1 Tax=Thraustotheca clavata TaxID=74557 RepID=A0A1V9ZCI0_9STRA|nr:calcium-activated potassium channel subunit alpha-1 [Thraustotheca clavata]
MYSRAQRKFLARRMHGESLHRWLARNMGNSLASDILTVLQVITTSMVVLLYLYKNWTIWNTSIDPPWLINLHLVIGIFFIADFAIRLYAADSRGDHTFSPMILIELLTICPQFIDALLPKELQLEYYHTITFVKTLRPWRSFSVFRLLTFHMSAKQRQILVLALSLVVIIIVFGAVFQAIESCPCLAHPGVDPFSCHVLQKNYTVSRCQDLEMYNSMYFVVSTVSTLGFGDVVPRSGYGRVTALFVILACGSWLPLQISKLNDVLSRQSAYDKAYRSLPQEKTHVVLCGDITASTLELFLHQFFKANQMTWNTEIVILVPGIPARSLQRLLLHPAYEDRVTCLSGSAMVHADLCRASVMTACACYIFTTNSESDTAANFFTISLRSHNKTVPIFTQIFNSDSMDHVDLSGATNILCIEQLAMGLLAKSCVVPGITAFVSVLLFNYPPFVYEKSQRPWVSDFANGARHSVYQMVIPKHLDRLITFQSWVYICRKEFNMLPFSVWDGEVYHLFPSKAFVRWNWSVFVLSTTNNCQERMDNILLSTLQKYSGILPHYDKIVQAWNFKLFSTQFKRITKHKSSVTIIPMVPTGRKRKPVSQLSTKRSSLSYRERTDKRRNAVAPHTLNNILPNPGNENSTKMLALNRSSYRGGSERSLNRRKKTQSPNSTASTLLSSKSTDHLKKPRSIHHLVHQLSNSQHSIAFQGFLETQVPDNIFDHIILLGMPSLLFDFITPLRPMAFSNPIPIVIISPEAISQKSYARIASYRNIYYLQGSALSMDIALQAKYFRAKAIVILSLTEESGLVDMYMADTEMLTLHRFVTQMCEKYGDPLLPFPTIIIQLVSSHQLALGRPSSLQFVREARDENISNMTQGDDDLIGHLYHPLFAAGKVLLTNMFDALFGMCTVHGSLIDLVHLLTLGDVTPTYGKTSQGLEQMPVPDAYWDVPYEVCFDSLLMEENILCLGIYRARSEEHFFVHINPPPNICLDSKDKLFVLRPRA